MLPSELCRENADSTALWRGPEPCCQQPQTGRDVGGPECAEGEVAWVSSGLANDLAFFPVVRLAVNDIVGTPITFYYKENRSASE